MNKIYRSVREDYIIVLDNIQELIIGAHEDNVYYYISRYRAYQKKLRWVVRKIARSYN